MKLKLEGCAELSMIIQMISGGWGKLIMRVKDYIFLTKILFCITKYPGIYSRKYYTNYFKKNQMLLF
jgi:hypothetical protein